MPANPSTPEVTRALKQCPFCGSAELGLNRPTDERTGTGWHDWFIRCYQCNIETAEYATEAELVTAWNTRTPARGGDELREATFAGYRLQGPDGEDYFNDTATPLSDNDRRNGWVETPLYALASTDMVGAGEGIRAVTAEMRRFMPNACGEWADRIDAILRGDVSDQNGSFACPICGQDTPHHHTPAVVDAYQNKRSRA